MDASTAFDPKAAARKLLREGRSGALATLMAGSGDPYCSLVNVATAFDGAPDSADFAPGTAHEKYSRRCARVA